MSYDEFVRNNTYSRPAPNNAFEHNYRLLDIDKDVIEFSEEKTPSIINGVAAFTGNIPKEEIKLYYEDGYRLATFYLYACKEPAMKPLFLELLVGWQTGIGMTKNKNYAERILQSMAGSKGMSGTFSPTEQMQQVAQVQQELEQTEAEEQKSNGGILSAINDFRKKQKQKFTEG